MNLYIFIPCFPNINNSKCNLLNDERYDCKLITLLLKDRYEETGMIVSRP